MSESENETETMEEFYERMGGKKEFQYRLAREAHTRCLEERIIALERGLEGVLRRLEASTSPDDEAGWFGRPE